LLDNGDFQEARVANYGICGDRRVQTRYPIELDLEYKIVKSGLTAGSGLGKTGNISSQGILFHPEEPVPVGQHVQLSIRWPAAMGNEPFIELWAYGRIVRSDPDGTAVQLSRHHFQKPKDPHVVFEQFGVHALVQ
jgi:hypothetical protein